MAAISLPVCSQFAGRCGAYLWHWGPVVSRQQRELIQLSYLPLLSTEYNIAKLLCCRWYQSFGQIYWVNSRLLLNRSQADQEWSLYQRNQISGGDNFLNHPDFSIEVVSLTKNMVTILFPLCNMGLEFQIFVHSFIVYAHPAIEWLCLGIPD